MNIHFTDIELFEKLKSSTIVRVGVGSHMYGNNNEESDIDYLYIYATSNLELNNIVDTHHQLQYKEDGIDHNFVSLHTFIKNTLSGDSTINFECINSDNLIGTDLEFLYNMRESFITYTVIRSYIGLCRRDVKHFYKADTDYKKKKRLSHIIRGYMYAKSMLDKEFNFYNLNKEFCGVGKDISDNKQLRLYDNLIKDIRVRLNLLLDGDDLGYAKNFNTESSKKLNEEVYKLVNSDSYISKQFDMSKWMYLYTDSFENWVTY